ncbi:MAG: acyl-CoA mutase large subunit family protein [bacterium]
MTTSGIPVETAYTSGHLKGFDPRIELGEPGYFPYTRGIHPSMYRSRLWTMRQYGGFGTATETNQRYRALLARGQTGLSVAFDLPTQMGLDSDHPMADGEVGKTGVAISTAEDMAALFDGIPLENISVSLTINAPASILWCFYLYLAERRGISWKKLSGTIQNDILKEYIARGTFIFPPAPSLRLAVDAIEFGVRQAPMWYPISVSGYHIREAGATPVQEIAFTLANAIAYVQETVKRGLGADDFAPRLSFFFNAHNHFLEEIAKFRAARRLWAHIMKDRFHAKHPDSLKLRFHTQTAGVTLTLQQPMNNLVRVTFQALAAVLGGTQSLHINGFDEAIALPTDHSATLALRTQQIIAHESGAPDVVDPLGGSCFIESLTNELERRAMDYLDRIDGMGGVLRAIEQGFVKQEIEASAYAWQREMEAGQHRVVGVNVYQETEESRFPYLTVDLSLQEKQIKRLQAYREFRDTRALRQRLREVEGTGRSRRNVLPSVYGAVKAGATLGEITGALKEAWGGYRASAVF